MKTDEQTLRYQKEIDKLNQQLAENEARQKKAADDARILRRKVQTAQRNMRTHRLCVLGALLEKHLREPDLLTTDDADRILSSIFADPSTYRIGFTINADGHAITRYSNERTF